MIEKINQLGQNREPFLFIISYDKQDIFAKPLKDLDKDILYKLNSQRNYKQQKRNSSYYFKKYPIPFETYKESFNRVIEDIKCGNTYLLNLTFKTPIKTDLSLKEIFRYSRADYKLYFKDKFICFSPESFIKIENNQISTYPMKGTIDASLPNAKEQILNNQKEMAEHIMIVDLMRNDLGIVANSIKVERFRYIQKIKAGDKELLQVSSHIKAKLSNNWQDNIGNILDKLTPAGSITGTPKQKTIEIIDNIEQYNRGFYTGVFGIFDGESLNSAVMIRFIEKENSSLVYKSGGGITIDSDVKSEYKELIDKIYLPLG
jgi:para-aminobenzoate synthetase component 1